MVQLDENGNSFMMKDEHMSFVNGNEPKKCHECLIHDLRAKVEQKISYNQ